MNNTKGVHGIRDNVYLKQRWDLIPNLVETVKGYAFQEKSVLTDIAALTPLTGIPVFFYKHKYLCKKSTSSSNFNIVCSSKFICSNNKKLGIDYILDPKNDICCEQKTPPTHPGIIFNQLSPPLGKIGKKL